MKKNRINRQDKQRGEQIARLEHLTRRDFMIDALKTGAAALSIPSMVSALLTETVALGAVQYECSVPMYQYHANGGPASAAVSSFPVSAAGTGRSFTPLGLMAQRAYGYDAATLPLVDAFGTKFIDFKPRPIVVTPAVVDGAGAVITPAVTTTGESFISSFLSSLTLAERALIYAVRFVVDSQDDNNTNLCGITKVYEASGLFKPPALLESAAFRNTETGMDNSSPFDLKIPPYVVVSAQDIPGQRSFSSQIPSTSQAERDKIGLMAQAANNLTNRHLANALADSPGRAKGALSDAVSQTMAYVNPTGAVLDPKLGTDATLRDLFGIVAGTSNNDADYRLAMSLAYMLNKPSDQRDIHSVVESNGGYDYHGNTAVSTQAKDASLGLRLGKVAKAAIAAGKDLCMIQTADGAVSCNFDPLSPIFATGDRGILGAFTMYFVHGNPSTSYTHDLIQVGKVGEDGRVALDATGKNDMSAAVAMAANVLHLNGVSDDEIMAALGGQIVSKNQMLQSRAIIRLT